MGTFSEILGESFSSLCLALTWDSPPSPVVAAAYILLPCSPSFPGASLPWASSPSSHPKRDF